VKPQLSPMYLGHDARYPRDLAGYRWAPCSCRWYCRLAGDRRRSGADRDWEGEKSVHSSASSFPFSITSNVTCCVLAYLCTCITQSPNSRCFASRTRVPGCNLLRDTPGSRVDIPPEFAPFVTSNTFIPLNKTDLLPISAQQEPEALIRGLPQYDWAVSLAEDAGTGGFLAGLVAALRDRLRRSPHLMTFLEFALRSLDAFLDTCGGWRILEIIWHISYLDHRCPRTDVEDVVLGAEQLCYAAQTVGKISGLVDIEDVLKFEFSSVRYVEVALYQVDHPKIQQQIKASKNSYTRRCSRMNSVIRVIE
jgi:hypothetical protein